MMMDKANDSCQKKKLLNWTIGILMLAAAGVLIATFNQGESKPPPRPTVPAGNGVVEGIVKFDAPRPPVQMIGGCKECVPVPDRSTVVNADGTLKKCRDLCKRRSQRRR